MLSFYCSKLRTRRTYVLQEDTPNLAQVGLFPVDRGLQMIEEPALEGVQLLDVAEDGRPPLLGKHVWPPEHRLQVSLQRTQYKDKYQSSCRTFSRHKTQSPLFST